MRLHFESRWISLLPSRAPRLVSPRNRAQTRSKRWIDGLVEETRPPSRVWFHHGTFSEFYKRELELSLSLSLSLSLLQYVQRVEGRKKCKKYFVSAKHCTSSVIYFLKQVKQKSNEAFRFDPQLTAGGEEAVSVWRLSSEFPPQEVASARDEPGWKQKRVSI